MNRTDNMIFPAYRVSTTVAKHYPAVTNDAALLDDDVVRSRWGNNFDECPEAGNQTIRHQYRWRMPCQGPEVVNDEKTIFGRGQRSYRRSCVGAVYELLHLRF